MAVRVREGVSHDEKFTIDLTLTTALCGASKTVAHPGEPTQHPDAFAVYCGSESWS